VFPGARLEGFPGAEARPTMAQHTETTVPDRETSSRPERPAPSSRHPDRRVRARSILIPVKAHRRGIPPYHHPGRNVPLSCHPDRSAPPPPPVIPTGAAHPLLPSSRPERHGVPRSGGISPTIAGGLGPQNAGRWRGRSIHSAPLQRAAVWMTEGGGHGAGHARTPAGPSVRKAGAKSSWRGPQQQQRQTRTPGDPKALLIPQAPADAHERRRDTPALDTLAATAQQWIHETTPPRSPSR